MKLACLTALASRLFLSHAFELYITQSVENKNKNRTTQNLNNLICLVLLNSSLVSEGDTGVGKVHYEMSH